MFWLGLQSPGFSINIMISNITSISSLYMLIIAKFFFNELYSFVIKIIQNKIPWFLSYAMQLNLI